MKHRLSTAPVLAAIALVASCGGDDGPTAGPLVTPFAECVEVAHFLDSQTVSEGQSAFFSLEHDRQRTAAEALGFDLRPEPVEDAEPVASDFVDALTAQMASMYYDGETVAIRDFPAGDNVQTTIAQCMVEKMAGEIDAERLMSATTQTGPQTATSIDGKHQILFAYNGADEELTMIVEPIRGDGA